MARAGRPVSILVYHPSEADLYAKLIQPGRHEVTLRVCGTPEAAAAAIEEAEVLYAWAFPPALLARARHLRWLQVMGAGVEWAMGPSLPRGVTVTRAPGIFGPWMVEYVLGWTLWVTQRMTTFLEARRERRWLRDVVPDRLRGKTMTVVGLGDIGRAVARAARALGVTVIGVSRSGRPTRGVHEVYTAAGLRRALAPADFVVVTVPLTPSTRGLIGRRELAAMRPTAWLMNIARGPVVDEGALLEALESRRIAGAILDVFDTEPLPAHHPLWQQPNVVITPHISGPSTPQEIAPVFNRNLLRYLAGQPLHHIVDRARGY